MDTISITNVRPVIEISSRPAKLNIKSKRPVMMVKHTPAAMHVNKKRPTFKANSLSLRAGPGTTPVIEMSRQLTIEAKQNVLDAIGQIVENGNMLMHVEYNNNPIAAIAEDRIASAAPDVNVGLVPPQREELEWDLGYLQMEWTRHELEIEWFVESKPEITFEPHSVEVRLRNHPEVKIKVNKNTVRNTVGAKVDNKV